METAYDLSSCERNGMLTSVFREKKLFKIVNLVGLNVCEDGKLLLYHKYQAILLFYGVDADFRELPDPHRRIL